MRSHYNIYRGIYTIEKLSQIDILVFQKHALIPINCPQLYLYIYNLFLIVKKKNVCILQKKKKLDGVGPVDNTPSTD